MPAETKISEQLRKGSIKDKAMIAGVRLPHQLFMHYIYKQDIYHFQADYYFTL